ncbi:DNA repair protein complementing XP-C cells homolog isoform X2 [Macrosteles quadrilineatus]|uniref:DNA repair protein complementing XP-C cells homolog isoform X2 n=1 Tax=Macrosteles quadrilineatus TaxID=74068 RepID=UPI0023E20C8A|nr:DNA repair protein complementing XP-C cells homolog isoform X2 [Macrosteles quadrilineatus]
MVKTRKGVKRFSPKSSKDEPPDGEKKKPKLELSKKSKYFNTENDSGSELNPTFDMNENKRPENSNSQDSSFENKSINTMKEEESDSDGSSSDEFMKAPISLDDLGSFETLKKSNKPSISENKPSFTNSAVSTLSDDSDVEKKTGDQEFYDFSQIIKSQELIKSTKRELEDGERKNEGKSVSPLGKKKLNRKTSKTNKKPIIGNKPDLKSIGEELGISDLLAIAEGQGAVAQDDSDDSESGVGNEEIKIEENYSVPKDGVQVTIELPNMNQIRKKKGVDVEAALKRRINLIRKENQIFMHKVHTLCWIAHGIYLNRCVNNELLMALALSLIPSNHCYPKKHMDLRYLEKLVEWFVGKVIIEKSQDLKMRSDADLGEVLEIIINSKKTSSHRDLVLVFVCLLRSLGINVRLVINLRSVPLRPPVTDLCSLSNKPKEEASSKDKNITSNKTNQSINRSGGTAPKNTTTAKGDKKKKSEGKEEIKSPYFSSSDDLPLTELRKSIGKKSSSFSPHKVISKDKNSIKSKPEKGMSSTTKSAYFTKQNNEKTPSNRSKRNRKSSNVHLREQNSSSDDEVFQKPRVTKVKSQNSSQESSIKKSGNKKIRNDKDFEPSKPSTSKTKDRRVLSTDEEENTTLNKIGYDYWAEVFVEEEEKWISVDLHKGKVHCITQLYKKATQPVRYVLAWNNDGTIKDVTRRYAPQWLTVTRRQRADDAWWSETMAPYKPPNNAREREEDYDLDKQLHDKPLPSSIADFKNHPLFALKRHLLKFQAIYPPDAPPLGFIKDEPVYSRGCVVELHTRETWIKEAKLVRRGEEPYKIVKARPKYDKLSGARLNDLPLPLFGYWQVEDYIPPPAVDGKVPRNEYGNVELYKPCMLPPGTVHLQVPGLGRVARKLDIDCAPAVVGWEFSGGGSHPVLDGFIVCEEFKDILLDAWNKLRELGKRLNREFMATGNDL